MIEASTRRKACQGQSELARMSSEREIHMWPFNKKTENDSIIEEIAEEMLDLVIDDSDVVVVGPEMSMSEFLELLSAFKARNKHSETAD
jgi:cellobiose-specific phosphotransferase system component IIB